MRFLSNRLFTPEVMIPDIERFVFGGMGGEMFISVVVDQTTIGGVQVLMAGILFSGRVLPIGFSCFVYEKIKRSQNILETGFLELISGSFPLGKLPVFYNGQGIWEATVDKCPKYHSCTLHNKAQEQCNSMVKR